MNFRPGEINIICTDSQKSLRFYRDILSFEVIGEEDGCFHLRCHDYLFLLLPVAQHADDPKPYCSVPSFSVDLVTPDLKAAYDYFVRHNVTFERPWHQDARSFIIRDPDGLVWEIIGRP